ncbi:hypothetical protein KIN20_026320 [Parelaphostrongylus tenuis]|uniref:Uncharacterized protein n=1 Tax=Parelaphostrongylus tenuis TaxID=148309 RepID=A0AAD5QXK1_PARTN|nr:hypothetical protein KIN20_026320 [Parelaphostrongylus tenuis]
MDKGLMKCVQEYKFKAHSSLLVARMNQLCLSVGRNQCTMTMKDLMLYEQLAYMVRLPGIWKVLVHNCSRGMMDGKDGIFEISLPL